MTPVRFIKHDAGTSAVEFGLTAPAFFLSLFIVIELGRLLWTQLGLQHAAEMAARCASVNTTMCGTATATQNYAATQVFGLTVPSSTFSISTPNCGIQVNASYDFAHVVGYFGAPSLNLTAQACFPK